MKKTPMRMCVACRNMFAKKDLLRIVRTDESVSLDFTGKKSGRGAYICDNPECIAKCVKAKLLDKVFAQPISDDVYGYIKEEYAKHSQNR